MTDEKESTPQAGFSGYQFRRAVRRAMDTGLQTWTPVVTQGASTPGLTVNRAVFQRRGPTIWAQLKVTFSQASAGAAEIAVTGLPSAAVDGIAMGTFHHWDGAANHIGAALFTSATTVKFLVEGNTTAYHSSKILANNILDFTIEYQPA